LLSAQVHAVDSSYTGPVRVGGYRVDPSNFAWLDGTPWNAFDSGNWNTGEPDNAGGIENSVEMSLSNGEFSRFSKLLTQLCRSSFREIQ
jgi:hypothetical protein